jgi:hypothetical protein
MDDRAWTLGSFSSDLFDLVTGLLIDLVLVVEIVRHGRVTFGRREVRVLSAHLVHRPAIRRDT